LQVTTKLAEAEDRVAKAEVRVAEAEEEAVARSSHTAAGQ